MYFLLPLLLAPCLRAVWLNSTATQFRQLPAPPAPPVYTAFSAYVEERLGGVRIIGTGNAKVFKPPMYDNNGKSRIGCWASKEDGCRPAKTTFIRSKVELQSARWADSATVLLLCPLGSTQPAPTSVFLFADVRCRTEAIKVPVAVAPTSPKVDVAVCLSPRVGWDTHYEILKSLPIYRELGAGIISVYQVEQPPPSLRELTAKELANDDVEVVPFEVLDIDALPYYFAEKIAINDCFMRNRLRATWVAVFDTDEYPLPYDPNSNWKDVLADVPSTAGHLTFLHSYCPPAKGIKALTGMPKKCFRPREVEGQRETFFNKSFSRANVTLTLYNHYPSWVLPGWEEQYIVPCNKSALFHLRKEVYKTNKFRKIKHAYSGQTEQNSEPRWLLERKWVRAWWNTLSEVAKKNRKEERKKDKGSLKKLKEKKSRKIAERRAARKAAAEKKRLYENHRTI